MVLYEATAQLGHNWSAATPQFFHRGYSVVMFTGSDCGGREGRVLSSLWVAVVKGKDKEGKNKIKKKKGLSDLTTLG